MSRFLFSSARHPAHPDTPLQALRHFKKPQAAFLFYFTNRVELNSPRFKVLPAAKRLYAHPARDPEGSFKRLANWLDASFYFFPSNSIPPPQNPGVTRIFSIQEGPAPEKRPLFRGHGSESSLVFRSKKKHICENRCVSFWFLAEISPTGKK